MHRGLFSILVSMIIVMAAFYILLNNASGVKNIASTATGAYAGFAKTARGQG